MTITPLVYLMMMPSIAFQPLFSVWWKAGFPESWVFSHLFVNFQEFHLCYRSGCLLLCTLYSTLKAKERNGKPAFQNVGFSPTFSWIFKNSTSGNLLIYCYYWRKEFRGFLCVLPPPRGGMYEIPRASDHLFLDTFFRACPFCFRPSLTC
jgi:hypothetical protein